jgi:hypothetical protein
MRKFLLIAVIISLSNLCLLSEKMEFYRFCTKHMTCTQTPDDYCYKEICFDWGKMSFYFADGHFTRELGTNASMIHGKLYKRGKTIVCVDSTSRKKYYFKTESPNSIKVLTKTDDLDKNTYLYLAEVRNSNEGIKFGSYKVCFNEYDLIKSKYYETGIRNGVFEYYDSKYCKYIFYNDNLGKDLIEGTNDSIFEKKKIDFFRKYYKYE